MVLKVSKAVKTNRTIFKPIAAIFRRAHWHFSGSLRTIRPDNPGGKRRDVTAMCRPSIIYLFEADGTTRDIIVTGGLQF